MDVPFIKQPNGSSTFYFPTNGPKTVSDPTKLKLIWEAVERGCTNDELLDLIDPTIAIVKHSSGLFGVKCGQVYMDGEALPDALSVRILDFVNTKIPFMPLLKFWENCKLNPDPRAKTDLYKFLEHNGHPITSDGCFIAYRAVRNDFLDKYTGTIDNSVGAVVKMNRADVDCDPNTTCSRGLHAAAYDYARNSYGTNGDVLVEVKINPKDVCAIPTDYNNQKMRVCEYTVLAVNIDGVIARPLYDPQNVVVNDDVRHDEGDQWSDDSGYDGDDMDEDDDNSTKESIIGFANDNWKTQKRDSNGRFLPKV